jgi:hypothetical protein
MPSNDTDNPTKLPLQVDNRSITVLAPEKATKTMKSPTAITTNESEEKKLW